MEKTQNAAVVPCNIGWKDIGCWFSYSTLLETDAQNNGGNAFFYESQNCTVQTAGRFVGAVGLENVVIIDTPDALLVANKNSAQSVKYVYEHLKSSSNDLHKHHQTVHRPWGTYTILEESEGHKVKRIEVTPGAKLSLQLHNHRSEHWTVVAGTGKARNGDRDVILQKNESIFIPLKTVHRMENIGEDKLVFVEVQIGDYLGEDDIIRYEDTYGRR
jgi:mannose-1-phosphate guanylyltransferase/mannose-6-phosphate isomerase